MKINRSSVTLAALVVLLVVVTNPELRALLLLADAFGGEVLLVLIWLQVRSFWPLIAGYAAQHAVAVKVVASTAYHVLRLCIGGLFPSMGLRFATTAAVLAVHQRTQGVFVFAFGLSRKSARPQRGA